jgi:hypothetical protein
VIGSNLTHRGMASGLAVRVSAPAAVSSDGFTGGARAQSARKTLVLVLCSFLGPWLWVSGLSKRMGHTAYLLTLASLGERSHRLSKARQNFEKRIMISRRMDLQGRSVMRRSALVKSEYIIFVGIP